MGAFQARLGEQFDDAKLREAFISPDYVTAEKERQRSLGLIDEEDAYSESDSDRAAVAETQTDENLPVSPR